MKKVKVKYCKYGKTDHTTPLTFNYLVHNILKKHYDVEISEDPDYVFFHESTYDYLNYDGIRIYNTGENLTPNFNLTDYATSIDFLTFGDRYFRLPPYLIASVYSKKDIELVKDIDFENPKIFTKEDLAKKKEFCSFVYSNYLADDRRKVLLDAINTYKKVNSGGRYLNNTGGPVENKVEFEMNHKFCMAIENSCRDGYTTDRIVNAVMANAIPIYWGNPAIGREFNTKRFLNCHQYNSFEEVVARIKEIDTNDELYLSMINEPFFNGEYTFKKAYDGFEIFLKNIFDQPLENAKRRTINQARAKDIELNEIILAKYTKKRTQRKKILAALYQPFKKIKALENFKNSHFKKKIR